MTNIPVRTLFKKAKDQKEGKSLAVGHRGTKPALVPELEADLLEWVAAMQRVGVPIGPSGILAKANEVYLAMQPIPTRYTTPPKPLTTGWYRRFIARHPILTPRIAQQIARVRNRVEAEAVRGLFYTMARLVIENNLDKSRVFNMDETSFMPKASSRKVVALKGPSNVWTQEPKANFHMTVVAAVNAAGEAVPPLSILPGQCIYREEMGIISVNNTTVTGTPKGFEQRRYLQVVAEVL
ncbi:hypothetical protein PC129_g8580 [Phytophthora cactorum]|uniref:HTH CENPB-type domain-containing protein n=1 Tax=Phytophthora cactorum TaxID=29920 RepID=A0A329SR58_9STRA|nr:hypothetical protein Pcac1_g24667 [Phytophthora cactorum]KAG2836130.1 hypothetical protein PC112_g5397 [Phytophthora cactorum]KAG2847599.1 hypothetical protein PC111_g716 [Phytophthora cactorum]KAG2866062.1 hypothetical protein PC113_g3150 [Phytophthora cactorum]KAG2932604.1 hypothetical protein PC114_g1798 [Phytophthora cactorum]